MRSIPVRAASHRRPGNRLEGGGQLAVTTISMNFHNDLNRVLEGRLNFPLGEGQTFSRFAMTVNGKLREGVVVEKAKCRQVFENIVRQGGDPGLLEWTKGNVFKACVYPIPEGGQEDGHCL
ncbi:MAG: hypothetical protein HOD72_12200 [Opitutae bacterium]|nr:hypothetical protein [Opitutae bacterium]MBT6463180.1 hypothetical protein [Opitutae bacterium]